MLRVKEKPLVEEGVEGETACFCSASLPPYYHQIMALSFKQLLSNSEKQAPETKQRRAKILKMGGKEYEAVEPFSPARTAVREVRGGAAKPRIKQFT